MARQKTLDPAGMDALRYLLDRDSKLGRRTAGRAVNFRERRTFERAADSRKRARPMVATAIVYGWRYPVLAPQQKAETVGPQLPSLSNSSANDGPSISSAGFSSICVRRFSLMASLPNSREFRIQAIVTRPGSDLPTVCASVSMHFLSDG